MNQANRQSKWPNTFRLAFILALGAAGGLAGCGTSAKVERRRPAEHSAGSARILTLVQVTGRKNLQDLLGQDLRAVARTTDWWTFRDRRNAEAAIFPNAGPGRGVVGKRPAPGEIYVRLDAQDAKVYGEKKDRKPSGPPRSGRGRVVVRFNATVADDTGTAIMLEREYAGSADGDIGSRVQRSALVRAAAKDGVKRFLHDITPQLVRERIALDTDSDDMEPIAKIVNDGQYEEARRQLLNLQTLHPRRADIVYNLAVLTDAQGAYTKALRLYEQALRLGFKSEYARSRNACRRRLHEREALGQ